MMGMTRRRPPAPQMLPQSQRSAPPPATQQVTTSPAMSSPANLPQIQRRKKFLAEQLMQSQQGDGPDSVVEGLADLGSTAIQGYFLNKVSDQEQEARAQTNDAFKRALASALQGGDATGLFTDGSYDNLDPGQQAIANALLERQFAGKDKAQRFEVGGNLVDENGYVVYQGPAKAQELPDDVREYEYAKSQGFQGSLFDYERQKAEAGRAPAQPKEDPLTQVWDGQNMVWLPRSQAAGMPSKAPENSGGPFGGTSLDAQAMNILLQGNPSSPEYLAAYNHMSQPRLQYDPVSGQTVSYNPNMSAYRPPSKSLSGQEGGQVPPPSQRGQPPAGPQANVDIQQTTVPKSIKEARAGAETIYKSIDEFEKSFDTAGTWDKVKSFANLPTGLNTAYNAAALQAKGEELFALGVLNGPDLDIIRRTVADPSTLAGATADSKDIKAQVKVIKDLLKTRLNEFEKNNNMPLTQFGGGDNDPLGIR